MNPSSYKCIYCSRNYKLKSNYQKHLTGCELFYQSQLKHPDEFTNSIESVPDIRQLYVYIRELASKCASLEQEVVQLKQHVHIKQKKQILSWLNTHRINGLNTSFIEWIRENIRNISYEKLEIVFANDLTEGIFHILESILKPMKLRPICAFTQKSNYLYICDRDSDHKMEWRAMTTDDMEKMVFHISQQFLIAFVKWQRENFERISASEKLKDEELSYMIKINGTKISMEKRCTDIKKRLYTLLEENLDLIEFI